MPVGNALRESIKEYNIKNEFRVVPNVIDTDLFKPGQNDRTAKHDDVKQIVMVAEQVRVKGSPDALKALKQVLAKRTDFILNIYGDGECRAEYEQLAKSLGLDNHVVFHGSQPRTTIAKEMCDGDFLLLTSLYETFSCVVVEAMASNLPVLTTSVGEIPYLLP
ncbi:MAG: glycosyltransferase family 4 protein, partial [Rubrobacteridae bacterium]|nr:glycosyltransferase family 4 protein [Rubrobacteridae bacterium]